MPIRRSRRPRALRPVAAALIAGLVVAAPAGAQDDRATPYWASIDVTKAYMRTGPDDDYPVVWVYKRKFLPVKILGRYKEWRKVEDPVGDTGWMHVRLLSADRTAIVTGDGLRPMYDKPENGAAVAWRAEPGVVGTLGRCGEGWCLFDVGGKRGYIRTGHIWGDEPLAGDE